MDNVNKGEGKKKKQQTTYHNDPVNDGEVHIDRNDHSLDHDGDVLVMRADPCT